MSLLTFSVKIIGHRPVFLQGLRTAKSKPSSSDTQLGYKFYLWQKDDRVSSRDPLFHGIVKAIAQIKAGYKLPNPNLPAWLCSHDGRGSKGAKAST